MSRAPSPITICKALVAMTLLLATSACERGAPGVDAREAALQRRQEIQKRISDRLPATLPEPTLNVKAPIAGPIPKHWPLIVANIVGFEPPDVDEDYTAEFVSTPLSKSVGEARFVVRRHENWVRIDEQRDGGSHSEYINLSTRMVASAHYKRGTRRLGQLSVRPLPAAWRAKGHLVSLRKAPVQLRDVVLPSAFLNINAWLAEESFPAEAPSYSALLTTPVSASSQSTVSERGRGGWRRRLITERSRQTLYVFAPESRFSLSAVYDAEGTLLNLDLQSPTGFREVSGKYDETVVDESCRWTDFACRTSDGAPLKATLGWKGDTRPLTVIKLSRAPLPPAAVLPPKIVLDSTGMR